MAIFTIKLSDETAELYRKHLPANPSLALEKQLERFKDYAPTERVLVLKPEIRRELEILIGHQLEDQEKFLRFVQKLMSIRLADLDVPLTELQIERLAGDAQFFRQDATKLLETRLKKFVSSVLGA